MALALASAVAWAGAPYGGKGVVAWWALDEAQGTTVADGAGGRLGGKLLGSAAVRRAKGPFGAHSLAFLDAHQEVRGSDAGLPAGSTPGSVSLWFNRPKGASNKVLFVYGTRTKGQGRGLWLVNERQLCFYFFANPPDLHVKIPGGVASDQWHHVVGTYDGTTARIYYDGKLAGSIETRIHTVLGEGFRIGANLYEEGRDYLGLIDDVAVLERALSADEVAAEYVAKAKAVAERPKAELRAWHALRADAQKARSAALAARVQHLDFDEIVFAVRQVDPDGHWYANFGYNVVDSKRRLYYHDGGRLCRLNIKTGKLTTLLHDATGGVRDPQVHYDAGKILFSYRKGGQPYYHLYEVTVDGSGLRQLTDGPYDDIEPTYLPDGGIVFVSSRCQRWVPCYVTQVAVLHRCDADGRNIRQLSANVEHENTPWPLPDGRILYQRWEYVDRSQVGYHHLWTMNPDGTGQMVYYGNQHPNVVMIDAKPIPGTHSVVASFSPGHGRNEHAGVITIVDPRGGPDARPMARAIAPGRHYRDPYPASADSFLVAGETDIALLDREGRTVRLFELPAEWRRGSMKVHEPRPVRRRRREPVLPSRVAPAVATGRVVLEDVHVGRNMAGVKRGEIEKLLVLEVLPKPVNMFSGMEPLSYGGTFLLERILGTVPVEADGSAFLEVPAMRPLFFVALDARDRAVKRMQSFMSVQPGESVSCVGCHENRAETPRSSRSLLAMRRGPSRIEPIAGVPDVLDFPRDIQPILDRRCVACHDYEKTAKGGPMAGGLIFAGDHGPMFSHSYYSLTLSGELCDGRNLRKSNYPPHSLGSGASRLLRRFARQGASARDLDTLRLWLDTGAVYAGTYAALGTGSIGEYSRQRLSRPDLAWPSTRAAQAVLKRRCAGCHKGQRALPDSPSDNKRMVPWGEGPMNALARRKSQRRNPAFHYNRHMLYNLTRPGKSLLLLAPLAREAGGFGGSGKTKKGKPPVERCESVFKDARDPDYQALLRAIQDAKEHLDRIKRFDMPGFRPCEPYLREMRRFGILAADTDPAAPIDSYALERTYWRSLWYRPVKP
ncbi:MAG: hypothetical protein ISS72_02080 [Candidatus Brocadiae bacterium]|nr:hypothetical protein [Candidatus Brocadiia bacterium]